MNIMRSLVGLAAIAIVLVAGSRSSAQTPAKTFYYIPHTHWEGAVFKTREEYLEMGLSNILKAVALLKKYPNFKFTLDQVAYFRPFLERYPEEAGAFRKFVKEGRLGIVGGMNVMPDVVKQGGELLVRQIQYGKQYCLDALGLDVTTAWQLDTFGHHPQIPQILKQSGFTSFWFCRGVPNTQMPSEFNWKGIDGTEIPAFWLPGFYGLLYNPPRQPTEFARFFEGRFNSLNPHARGDERVGLAGVDVSEPEEWVPPLADEYNKKGGTPFNIRYSIPSEFEAVVARRKDKPTLTGDFNPIFQGTYSSRIELKQMTREVEQRLLTAEKLGAIAAWMGTKVDRSAIMDAWEPTLFNQTHDLSSGVMTDHVYDDVVRGFDFSLRRANEMTSDWSAAIAQRIDTRGTGIPVVVFNTLGWERSDSAEVEVGFADAGVQSIVVEDARGNPTPSQFLFVERYHDGGLKRAKVVFLAKSIPSMGYSTYRVVGRADKSGATAEAQADSGGNVLENEFYRVAVDRSTGAITSLFDKAQNWEALSGPGNVVSREVDKGDLWELYHGLDGASHIAHTNKQPVPKAGAAMLSTDTAAKESRLVRGPVFSEFTVAHPLANGTFATRIRLYLGSRRVEVLTDLVNNEKYVRYQVQFPTTVKNGKNVQEIAFGSVERPIGVEYPALQWTDYSDGQRGVTLLNRALPGNLVSEDTLLLSLHRSHNLGAYGFGGGYEPGMSSESGFQIGKRRTFDYAVSPHSGDWAGSGAYRTGLEFNHPLLVRKVDSHPGRLPASWGFVTVSHPNVVLTAVKPGPDGSTVVRVYEASGKATAGVSVKLNAQVISANETNLLEAAGRKLTVKGSAVTFDLHPYEIKTIRLKLAPAK